MAFKKWVKSAFVNSCLSNRYVQEDFRAQDQRECLCNFLWEHKKTKAKSVISVAGEEYIADDSDYIITPDDEGENDLDKNDQPKKSVPDEKIDPDVKDKNDKSNNDNNIFINPKDHINPEQDDNSKQYKSGPMLKNPVIQKDGIAPQPDDNFNYPTSDHKNPKTVNIDDVKWLPAQAEDALVVLPNPDFATLAIDQNPPGKPIEFYIASIDEMTNDNANWPLSFDKIEKDFERGNKPIPEDTKVIDKNKNIDTPNNIDKKEKPYVI